MHFYSCSVPLRLHLYAVDCYSTVKSSVDAGSLSISTSNYMQVDDHKASVGEGEDSLVSTIHEAFAGDEVTQQFEEESSLETNKTTQLTETALPGELSLIFVYY